MSSGTMAFAGMGDAFLYPVLPVYGQGMGVSAFAIGVLLSVNRLVRIVANTYVANLVARFGTKHMLVVSSFIAVATTVFYGLNLGLVVFFVARVLWGLCYSGLKIATLNYATSIKGRRGLAFAVSQSTKSMGALLVLSVGPMLVKQTGIEHGFYFIATISVIGLVLALCLPKEEVGQPKAEVKAKNVFYPSSLNMLVFTTSIVVDGILVVGLALLLGSQQMSNSELLALVAIYLLGKKLLAGLISLLAGVLSLYMGTLRLYTLSIVCIIVGLLLIAANVLTIGILMVFLFNAIVVTFSPLVAIEGKVNKSNPLQAISGVSTWWDLGAALGAFAGVYLIEMMSPGYLFLSLSLVILSLFINFIKQNGSPDTRII